MSVSAVTVAHSVDHLAGQLRRGRSDHRTLIRVDADALAITLAELERARGEEGRLADDLSAATRRAWTEAVNLLDQTYTSERDRLRNRSARSRLVRGWLTGLEAARNALRDHLAHPTPTTPAGPTRKDAQ